MIFPSLKELMYKIISQESIQCFQVKFNARVKSISFSLSSKNYSVEKDYSESECTVFGTLIA